MSQPLHLLSPAPYPATRMRRLRQHGWSDSQIAETIAQVALNLFTNYVNIALDVPVDFPAVPLSSDA